MSARQDQRGPDGPLRIAFVVNSAEGGGAALPVPDIAAVMQQAGAEVRVFALTRRDGLALPAMTAAGLDPLVREGGRNDHVAALTWLERVLREWGATHMWCSLSRANALGLIAGPRLGIPVVCWQHNALPRRGNRLVLSLLQSRAAFWVPVCRFVEEITRERLHVEPARLETWPIFHAPADMPQAAPWRPGEVLRLGTLGRLHPVKGYDVLVEALTLLRKARFAPPTPFSVAILGEGEERARLEAMIAAGGVGDWISLPGYTDRPREALAAMHLYLQPSHSEGICIAAHEAMAAGLPVIASRVAELAYSIEPGRTGWLVPPGEPAALAGAIREAVSAPDRLAAMGSAARETIFERFSEANYLEAGARVMARIRRACA